MTHNRLAKMLFNDNSNDEFHLLATMIEEEEMANEDRTPHRPGSILGHAVIQCDRVQDNDRLYRDYFADTPTFGPRLFRRRFRMNHQLFFAFNMLWKLMIHTLSKEGMLVERWVCLPFKKFQLLSGCLLWGTSRFCG